jgi:sulfite reductase (NADPH) flavoprotein alpha-component
VRSSKGRRPFPAMQQHPPSVLKALRLLGLGPQHPGDAVELGPLEAAWLSGYFAALARGRSPEETSPDASPSAQEPTLAKPAHKRVRVLYGTETGNAKALAHTLAERLRSLRLDAEVSDLANYKARSLEAEQAVVIVTSTHGDGTPPEPALRFFEQLSGATAPKSLSKLQFAVLGLGDSSYEHFCRAARTVDERLLELGASRLLPRLDCDVDFAEPAARWIEQLLATLAPAAEQQVAKYSPVAQVSDGVKGGFAVLGSVPAAAHTKQRPFEATVLENTRLTGRGSSKETRHVALSIASSGLTFAPGDALGVCAPNHPALVGELLAALHLTGDEQVALAGGSMPLAQALCEHLDVTVPAPRFLAAWAELSRSTTLRALVPDQAEAERRRFLRAHHVLDIVREFPAPQVDADALARSLRPLSPRLYSLASSLAACPDEAHLTVSVVRYQQKGRGCTGVASGHIAEHAQEGQTLRVYVQANDNFRLPKNPDAPVLMIGAGTGVAPYRAFLQERQAAGARGKTWLFFGERNFHSDFLYQTEWQSFLRDGTLHKLTPAFSRDQADKVYVQTRLREHGRDVFAWLEEGAHVYVCGDAQALAPAVHEALLAIVEERSSSREQALVYLSALRDQHRYQRDVY